jgi:hypothetical protein
VNVSNGLEWVGCNCPSAAAAADDDAGGYAVTSQSMNGDEDVLDVAVQWQTSTFLCSGELGNTMETKCNKAIQAGGM